MVTKKDLVIAVLSTFCLTATLFMIIPTRSSPGEKVYDPWADLTGPLNVSDGVINMRDIAYVTNLFGASGNTTRNVTVTNWPDWCWCGTCIQPGIYKEVEEITVLEWTSTQSSYTTGVEMDQDTKRCFMLFNFAPKGQSINVTDFWILIIDAHSHALQLRYDATLNDNLTKTTDLYYRAGYVPRTRVIHFDEEDLSYVHPGINTLELHNIAVGNQAYIYRVTVFIEYEYEIK